MELRESADCGVVVMWCRLEQSLVLHLPLYCSYEMDHGLVGEDVGTRRLNETPDCHPSERKKLWEWFARVRIWGP